VSTSLESLIATGTKLWLDSVDPDLIAENLRRGATGATSNPIIISELIKSGRYDGALAELAGQGSTPAEVAWLLTDRVVSAAQQTFLPIWDRTQGDNGYVSFEVDPLLEDPSLALPHQQRVDRYVSEALRWSHDHCNRMIKVPATPAGIAALPELAAQGTPLNVTLIFTLRQYRAAREAVWLGAQRLADLQHFKSVYSIFISRVDVYTEQQVPGLSQAAQGQVGIVNAKLMWRENQRFWQDRFTPLRQEIIFASTGTKKPTDAPWKYPMALAGSDIQTNPPATNQAIAENDLEFTRTVDRLPPQEVLDEIAAKVDMEQLERQLMAEGIRKFADPQRALQELIAAKMAR
jgi:transaldolase